MKRFVLTLLVLITTVPPALGQSQIPRPLMMTPNIPIGQLYGRLPNQIGYEIFQDGGRARMKFTNAAAVDIQTFTVWVALFESGRKLIQVYSFTPPDLLAGEESEPVWPAAGDQWPREPVTSYRLVYWARPIEYLAIKQSNVGLIKPIKGGLTHTTPLYSITFEIQPEEVGFTLMNRGTNVIRVIWDESAFIDQTGRSHRVIHAGIRYIERDKPVPPTTIPPGARLEDIFLPTSYVNWTGRQWDRRNIFSEGDPTPFTFGVYLQLLMGNDRQGLSYQFQVTSSWPAEVRALFNTP